MVLGLIWALAGVGGGGNKNYPNTHNCGSILLIFGMASWWLLELIMTKYFFDLEKITHSDRNKTTIYFA